MVSLNKMILATLARFTACCLLKYHLKLYAISNDKHFKQHATLFTFTGVACLIQHCIKWWDTVSYSNSLLHILANVG